jgi:hypothetical protein
MRLLVTEIIPSLVRRMLENVYLAGEKLAGSIYGLQIFHVDRSRVAEG